MKVLVATAHTQGDRRDDYHRCVEGELVRIEEECTRDRGGGECGCGRGFAGLNSHGATTTACIAEVALSRADYIEAIRSSLEAEGRHWCADCTVEEADVLAALVADWPVGTVFERHLHELVVREPADTG